MAFNALRYSYLPREPDKFDVGPMIDRFRQGEADGNARRVRNALGTAGSMAASGDMTGASNELLGQGELNAGFGLRDRQRADATRASAASAATAADAMKMTGRLAQLIHGEADPQKKQQMWAKFVGTHPEIGNSLKNFGVDPGDYDTGSRFLMSEAGLKIPEQQAADMRVVGGKVVRISPDGTVQTAYDSSEGMNAGGGVESLFGGADNLSQSLLSGNFDKDLEAILQGVSPNNRAKVWVTAQQIKQRALKAGTLTQQPVAPAAGPPMPSQPLPAATPSIDQQRLEMVAQRFADAPAAQKNDAFRIQSAANSIEKNLARYEELVGGTGYVMPGEVADSDAVGAEIRNLQLQLKELYNLGVLNGPDLSLMEQVLVDPRVSGMAGMADAGIDSVFGGGGSARVKASVSRMRTMLNDVLRGRNLEAIGEGAQAPPPAPRQQGGAGYSGMSDDELSRQWQ